MARSMSLCAMLGTATLIIAISGAATYKVKYKPNQNPAESIDKWSRCSLKSGSDTEPVVIYVLK